MDTKAKYLTGSVALDGFAPVEYQYRIEGDTLYLRRYLDFSLTAQILLDIIEQFRTAHGAGADDHLNRIRKIVFETAGGEVDGTAAVSLAPLPGTGPAD